MAGFNAITSEQVKCLVWICGLHTPGDADIGARALRKLEDNPQTTIKGLDLEIQQFLNIKEDAKMLKSAPSLLRPEVNAVAIKENRTRDSPAPCFRCGGWHPAKECYFVKKRCHDCKLVRHKKGYCKNFAEKKKRYPNEKRRTTNSVVVTASNGTDVAPAAIQMRIDTGTDFTLLSVKDWIKISRAKLLPALVKLKRRCTGSVPFYSRFTSKDNC
ncbi:unnamed protein product [Toxocara canis]|uniref:Peptidase A2 domain-containing protein n=1 Tax=Toxocara canis TaxID=6265 RepID=A0A183UGW1_TOXCA|nr:unnamed protein product [Toxocara canis]